MRDINNSYNCYVPQTLVSDLFYALFMSLTKKGKIKQ